MDPGEPLGMVRVVYQNPEHGAIVEGCSSP